jgi:uncharacterized membrane protein
MLKSAETLKSRRATLVAISLIVVIAALLRLHNLGTDSLWLDEAESWREAKDGLVDLIRRTADDIHPPLHNLVLFAVIKLLGDSEWSLRLPSAIFGLANIVALYWLGTMTVGRTAGLIGAVLLTFSPFHLQYSQEARMYSLLALAATLYAATCFHYLRTPSVARGALVSLAGLVLLYSHPYGVLNLIAIALAFTIFALPPTFPSRQTVLTWVASNVVAVAAFLPWALILAHHAKVIETKGFWIAALTPESMLRMLQDLTGGGLLVPGAILVGVVLALVGRLRPDVMVLCVWIITPVVVGIVASTLSTPVLITRYVIGSLPPLFLLCSFGWIKFTKSWQAPILLMVIVAMAGLSLWRHDPYTNWKDDWRSVALFLKEREQADDCVLTVPYYYRKPLIYYRRNSFCEWEADTTAKLPTEMNASVLFAILALRDATVTAATRAAVMDALRRQGWRELDRADFRGLEVVTLRR